MEPAASSSALGRGESCFAAGHWVEAESAFREVLAPATGGPPASPSEAGLAHRYLGRVHLRRNDARKALDEFSQASKLRPQDWEVLYWRGCAEGHAGNLQAAEVTLTSALGLTPNPAACHLQRARVRCRLKAYPQAIQDYEAVERAGVLGPEDCLTLARLYLARSQPASAARLLAIACEKENWPPIAAFLLGWAREKQDQPEAAVQAYRKAANSNVPQIQAAALERLGVLNALNQRLERAIGCFEFLQEVMESRVSNVALLWWGWACWRLGRWEECFRRWDCLGRRVPAELRAQLAELHLRLVLRIPPSPEDRRLALRHLLAGHSALPGAATAWVALSWQELLRRAEQMDWEGVSAVLEELRAPDQGGALAGRLPEPTEVTRAGALFHLHQGQPAEAIRLLERSLARRAGGRTAHTLGLLCSHYAAQLEAQGMVPEADGLWRKAAAAWAFLFHDSEFWRGWQADAERRYGVPVTDEELSTLRRELEEELVRLCPGPAVVSASRSGGRRADVEFLLQHELRGARLVAAMGGIEIASGAQTARLTCGPTLVAILGLGSELAHWMAKLAEWVGGPLGDAAELTALLATPALEPDSRPAMNRTTWQYLAFAFSSLGHAFTLLSLGRPDEALRALEQAACPTCQARGPVGAEKPCTCGSSCPEFDRLNPAYALLPNKAGRLMRDARLLGTAAHLTAAGQAIATVPVAAAEAARHWRLALDWNQAAADREELRRRIADEVLGWVDRLRRHRLDDAIQMLEEARTVLSHPDFDGRLGQLLNNRGVEAGNADPPRWDAAVNDLRRAVVLNPYAPGFRLNCGLALMNLGAERRRALDLAATWSLIEEWSACVNRGLMASPASEPLREQQREVRQARRVVLREYADQLALSGRLGEAADLLARGQREDPDDTEVAAMIEEMRLLLDRG